MADEISIDEWARAEQQAKPGGTWVEQNFTPELQEAALAAWRKGYGWEKVTRYLIEVHGAPEETTSNRLDYWCRSRRMPRSIA